MNQPDPYTALQSAAPAAGQTVTSAADPAPAAMPDVTDEQRAAIIAAYVAQARAEQAASAAAAPPAAEQAVSQVVQAPAGDAGESLGSMSVSRAATLPAEDLMNELMEQQRKFSEQLAGMQAQLSRAQADAAAVRAITGPPPVTVYADAVAAKLAGHANANPDLPPGHFDDVLAQAAELAKQARALADGQAGAAASVGGLAGRIERFLTRTHAVKSGKALDFSAIIDELAVLLDEADKLAPAA